MFHDGPTAEGLHMAFRQTRLELDLHSIGLFLLPFVVSHTINEDSPLWGMTQKRLLREKIEFILVFEGVVEVTGNTLHARTSYLANEIKWGRFFSVRSDLTHTCCRNEANIRMIRLNVSRVSSCLSFAMFCAIITLQEVNFRDEDGTARVDWRLFDETIACSTFNDTTLFDGKRLGYRRRDQLYEGRSEEEVLEEDAFDQFIQTRGSSTPNQAGGIELSEFGTTSFRTTSGSSADLKRPHGDGHKLRFPLPPANGFGGDQDGEDADDVPLLGGSNYATTKA
jgi:hypothetical protein